MFLPSVPALHRIVRPSARDDPAAMKQYVDYYGSGYVGLTGPEDEIARAAADWGVSYRRLPSESPSGCAMAHSTEACLPDAEGMLRQHMFGAGADLIVEKLREVAGS